MAEKKIWTYLAVTGVLNVTLGFLLTAFSAFGEELGWRGLLVPELAKVVSFGKASFFTPVITSSSSASSMS